MEISRQECESAVRCALDDVNHILVDYKVQPASDSPIGFMGIHFRIEATVLVDGKEKKVLRMFAKRPPKTEAHQDFVNSCDYFKKETSFYTSYMPGLKSMLSGELKLPFAECYYACGTGETDKHVIILENLDLRGFKMMDKRKVLDLDHCKVVLDALARLHGASALLQNAKRNPEAHRWTEEFEKIEEKVFPDDPNKIAAQWCKSASKTLASTISRMWPERFEDKTDVIFELAWKSWQEVFKILPHGQNHPCVLCHGDPWANNIMVSYRKGENGNMVPEEAMLIDLQQQRYSSPASDIAYFLHTTTSRKLREEHFDDLIVYYWEAFRRVVTPEFAAEFLPLDRLKVIVERMRLFARMISTSLLSTVLIDGGDDSGNAEEEKDFIKSMLRNRSEEVLRFMNRNPNIKERLQDCYQDFLESVGLWSN